MVDLSPWLFLKAKLQITKGENNNNNGGHLDVTTLKTKGLIDMYNWKPEIMKYLYSDRSISELVRPKMGKEKAYTLS